MNFTQVETQFLAHFGRGDHPVLAALRQQLAGAEVADRELTRAGVRVTLAVSAAAPRMPLDSTIFGDVGFLHPEAPTGGGAVLFVHEGYAQALDIACYVDDWPRDEAAFNVHYLRRDGVPPHTDSGLVPSAERDMSWFIEEFS